MQPNVPLNKYHFIIYIKDVWIHNPARNPVWLQNKMRIN